MPEAPRYGESAGPYAIAHRGGAGLAPENTMEAFARSYALGVRYLETDVRVTADGVAVAFHDATVDRVTAARGPVSRLTYAHLRTLRVGGHRIPRLESVLRAFPDACFMIDVKDETSVGAVADVMTRTNAARRVCIAGAWDSRLTALCERVGPDLNRALGWRALAELIAASKLRMPLRPCGTFAHVPLRMGRLPIFERTLTHRAHDLGIRVFVWTVNEPAVMHSLLDHGVDGIITDRPDLLREVMISRGQWLPPTPSRLAA